MKPLEMILEWKKGCSCAPTGHPEKCSACTVALIEALEKRLASQDIDRIAKTCENCNFWEPPKNESWGEVPGVGRCSAMVQFWQAGEWDYEAEGRKLKPEFAKALAFVQDGSDYRADLYTKPEFGCIMWKDKQ